MPPKTFVHHHHQNRRRHLGFLFLVVTLLIISSFLSIFDSSCNLRRYDNDVNNNDDSEKKHIIYDNDDVGETAIIITSSWIQSFPTLNFINQVVDSIDYINGLHPNAPIYIAVDGLKQTSNNLSPEEIQIRLTQLDQYTQMLYEKYDNHSTNTTRNIHIVISSIHKHISGNVQKCLQLIETHYPSIQYLYYMQHDFAFKKPIHHTGLVKSMKENPNQIKIIRFLYFAKSHLQHVQQHRCLNDNDKPIEYQSNGIYLQSNRGYSDNNHFANFTFYKTIIDSLGSKPRPPEIPLMYKNFTYQSKCLDGNNKGGNNLGIWTYQNEITGQYSFTLKHLDGRNTKKKKKNEFNSNK